MANSSRTRLTETSLRKLTAKDRTKFFTDARQEGLQVCCTPNGVKTFYYRYRLNGKSCREKIGRWPDCTLEEARDAVRQRVATKQSGEQQREGLDTFEQAFHFWLEGHAKKAKKTWQEDERKFRRDLKALHNVPLGQLTQTFIERVHADLGKTNGKIMANRALALIKTVINYAIDRDDFAFNGKNPARGITKFPEKERERYLSKDELHRLSLALFEEDELWRDFFTTCLFCGARRGNVQEMEWRDVNLERCEWLIPETKNGKSLLVMLSPPVVEILTRRKSKKHARCKWVFPSNRKPSDHIKDVRKAWLRITARSGLTDVTVHDLRRTMGSYQAMAGASALIIGKSLGHSERSKATHIYARFGDEPVRKSVGLASVEMASAMEGKRDE